MNKKTSNGHIRGQLSGPHP